VPLRGVGAECVLDTGLLILMFDIFLPTNFLALDGGAWAAVALRLSARVFDEPAHEFSNVAPTKSAFGPRAEIGVARIGVSPSKSGICDTKLSRAYNESRDI
jgi:hypothetical protein